MLTALFLPVLLAACASTQGPDARVTAPEKLRPGANEALTMIVSAKGVQVYECRAKKDQTGAYEWAFVAPQAELVDERGKGVGKHYAGPHWEAADGSKIVGTVRERSDAPTPDAIPWLLLAAKSVGAEGAFSRVTSIQRVNTRGGLAPGEGCSQATVGSSARVGYTADYYFFSVK
jgi:hypothetical protein